MKTTTSGSEPYRSDEEERSETKSSKYKKETGGWTRDLGDLINELGLPRLVLILLFVIYGLVAFSKGRRGVEWHDLIVFLVFIVTSIIVFLLLVVLQSYWKQFEAEFIVKLDKILNRFQKK